MRLIEASAFGERLRTRRLEETRELLLREQLTERTLEFERYPLPLLLRCYERFGPVFTIRLLYAPIVFALGPEANHYITVSHASNFRWRDGSMGDLIPLLGDGLLTTDGDYHRRARRSAGRRAGG